MTDATPALPVAPAMRPLWPAFLVFAAVGLALAWPALSWPMVYDDLHLIRSFDAREVRSAFLGHWDPDGIETRGWRPLGLLFNHARYLAFGEDVVAHRLFLIGLFAAYLTLLSRIALELGVSRGTAIAAGVLCVCARYNVYHYVWISDGIHFVPAVAVCGAALWLMRGLAGSPGWLALAWVAWLAGFLAREDTLATLPVLLLLGFLRGRRLGLHTPARLAAFAGALAAAAGMLLVYRALVVPDAPPLALDVEGLVRMTYRMLHFSGLEHFDGWSRAVVYTWRLALLLLGLGLLGLARRERQRSLTWLACALLACTPNLTLQRDNLLLFATGFAAMAYTVCLAGWWRSAGRAGRVALAGLFLSCAAGAGHLSRVFATNFHPYSMKAVGWNADFLYGRYVHRATIPPERRRRIARQLAAVGIRHGIHLGLKLRAMAEDAVAAGRRRPGPEEVTFVSWLPGVF